MSERYDASQIQILPGLEGVRRRPSMYIGDVGKRGLHHLIFEILDNAVDEALAGYAKNIIVSLNADGSCTIKDDGRGIPVDLHPIEKKPGVEIVFTYLHAGGKFDQKVYQISGGLHGVGASVVCALSEYLEVKVKRNGKIYYQKFSRGKKVSELEEIGETSERGTEVKFKPDPEIFKKLEFEFEIVEKRLREISFLVRGLRLTIIDEKTGKTKEFYSEGGLKDFVNFLDEEREPVHEPFWMEAKKENVEVEIALQYNSDYQYENILSFVNTINTHEGGTHVTGFKSALTRVIVDYIKKNNMLKSNDIEIQGEDTREGLTACIHVKIPSPQFEGQTKTKLGNSNVKGIVESLFYDRFYRYLEENPQVAEEIVRIIIATARAREAAKKAKELTKRKSLLESVSLPGKLADCSTKDPSKAELFVVEGESAGGSAKQARAREFQAILPLRGKILNVEKASIDKILKNDEIKAIFQAIGVGLNEEDFKPEKIRYHKVIIMTDADVDGSHIRTLLLTLFFRYMRPLIELGYLYIAQPPLYRIQKSKKVYYAYSEEEKEEILKKLGGEDGVNIQRYKGLGEMNPDQLWETTMDPERRILKRVTLEDAAEADKLFSILMGEKTEPRREFIIQNAKKVQNLDI
ncbi:MAG: DNA topoisomerase (ATP-hydrolyzing) subunit B [Candidatus Hydrothermales bacterium]